MLSCLLWMRGWGGWGEFSIKGTLGEVPAGVPRVDVCVWLYGRRSADSSHPPTVLYSGQGLHYPTEVSQAISGKS